MAALKVLRFVLSAVGLFLIAMGIVVLNYDVGKLDPAAEVFVIIGAISIGAAMISAGIAALIVGIAFFIKVYKREKATQNK